LSPLIPLFSWREKDLGAEKLYGAIVAQARLPVFYQGFGVPDTLEGRFVVLSLNLCGDGALATTIAEALPLEGPAAEAAGRHLAYYLKGVVRRLDTEPLSGLQSGEVKFPEIDLEFR